MVMRVIEMVWRKALRNIYPVEEHIRGAQQLLMKYCPWRLNSFLSTIPRLSSNICTTSFLPLGFDFWRKHNFPINLVRKKSRLNQFKTWHPLG